MDRETKGAAATAKRSPASAFVGRESELVRADAALEALLQSGSGSLFAIVGEAGIGKTRLASEISRRAMQRGADVLWGRCWEDEGAPPYWPWIQVFRALAEAHPAPELETVIGSAAPLISVLAPEVVARIPRTDVATTSQASALPSSVESERFRFRLFDAVAEVIRRAASRRPLVLVFDDLHSADLPSLLMLQFVARLLPDSGIMIVVTKREADARLVQHGQPVFAALARLGERIGLRGWNRDEIAGYLAGLLDKRPAPRLVEIIVDVTRGNPLFVDGFARAIRDRADLELLDGFPVGVRIPDSVRAVIRERLRPLPESLLRVLEVAAVVGRRFEARAVAAVADVPLGDVLDGLAIAVSADILTEPAELVGDYSFAHPLIRDTVYADIAPAARIDLHHRIATVLEEVYADRLDEKASSIAHHYFEAAYAEDATRAVALACRAAERAIDQCAYEEAAHLYRRAVAALDAAGADEETRCELLVALGEAHLRAGNAIRAREICADAALVARGLGAGELLARAALTFGGIPIGPGIVDPELIGLLEESRRLLGAQPSALRAIVSARLAVRLHMPSDGVRRIALCREALEDARRSGNDEALAHALDARHLVHWSQNDPAGQLAIAEQLMGAAESCGNRELLLYGHQLRLADFLEMGDIEGVDREIEHYAQLASELRQAPYTFRNLLFRSMRSLVAGDFERSDRLASEAHGIGRDAQAIVADTYFGVQRLALERLRGREGETESLVRRLVDAYPTVGALRVGLAALYADFGRVDAAAAFFERLAVNDFRDMPVDNNWLVGIALAAEICASIGDATRADVLYEMLAPYAGRIAVGGSGAACNGCVSRPLGLLARLLGRRDAALAHLTDALEREASMGALALAARTRLDLAETLLGEDGHGTSEEARGRAHHLAEEARAAAVSLGMERVADRAERILDTRPAPPLPQARECLFRREGDYWEVAFEAESTRLKDIRGLHYLARLLAAAGEEMHCLDLVSSGSAAGATGDAGELLDARAKAEYRQRLRSLDAEIEEAQSFNDPERAERARAEMEALAAELSRAIGLGGRARRAGSAVERARVTVAKSIRLALARIAEHAPQLGEHLQATVRTGVYCSYTPDPRSRPDWQL